MQRMEIYRAIDEVRKRQSIQHGGHNHDRTHTINDWIVYTNRQLAKASRTAEDPQLTTSTRHALIEAAAVIVAALESWRTPERDDRAAIAGMLADMYPGPDNDQSPY